MNYGKPKKKQLMNLKVKNKGHKLKIFSQPDQFGGSQCVHVSAVSVRLIVTYNSGVNVRQY